MAISLPSDTIRSSRKPGQGGPLLLRDARRHRVVSCSWKSCFHDMQDGMLLMPEASTSLPSPTSLGGMARSHHHCAVLGLHFGFARQSGAFYDHAQHPFVKVHCSKSPGLHQSRLGHSEMKPQFVSQAAGLGSGSGAYSWLPGADNLF